MNSLIRRKKLSFTLLLFFIVFAAPISLIADTCPENAVNIITRYQNMLFQDMLRGNFSRTQEISAKIIAIQTACAPSYNQPPPYYPAQGGQYIPQLPHIPPSIYQDGGTIIAPNIGGCDSSGCYSFD